MNSGTVGRKSFHSPHALLYLVKCCVCVCDRLFGSVGLVNSDDLQRIKFGLGKKEEYLHIFLCRQGSSGDFQTVLCSVDM